MKITIKYLVSQLYSIISRLFCKKTNKLIYIISFHRSGSTWVAETLSKALKAPYLHEPLNVKENFQARVLNKPNKAILPVNKKRLEQYFQNLNSKNILSRWSLSRTSFLNVIKTETLIVKFIRANFLFSFIKDSLKDVTIIILLRNPFAITESVLNGGLGFWNPPTKNNLIYFYEDLIKENENLKSFINHKVSENVRSLLLVRWCIEYGFIQNFITDSDNVIYYELLKDSDEEKKKLANAVGKEKVFEDLNDKIKSSTTSIKNFIDKNDPYWIDNYNKELKEEAIEILNFFKIDIYSFNKYYPNIELK